jgi:GntR family transcriptional regulator
MAREHKVSVITVQRAYEDLEKEELIYTRRGKGFFVSGLTDRQRTDLAQKRFEEALGPLVDAAFDEGLPLSRIKASVDTILEEKRDKS